MGKKLTFHDVYEYVSKKGFTILDNKYGGDSVKMNMGDSDGYLYYTSYGQIRSNNPHRFFGGNPYTEQNIILWINKNKRPFSLVLAKSFDGSADSSTITAGVTAPTSLAAVAGTFNGTKEYALWFIA